MHISADGLAFIEGWEGGQSVDGLFHAYLDTVASPPVWTIGYGETAGVYSGMTWTKARATADLRNKIERDYEPAIRALNVFFNQHQWDALCSFIWNVGPGALNDPIGGFLRARNFAEAMKHLLLYNKAGGVVVLGLTRRREAEVAMFNKPWDPLHYMRFETVTRTVSGKNRIVRFANERETVEEYDAKRKHPARYPLRLLRLRSNLKVLANRIQDIRTQNHDPDGKLFNRKWREDNLRARSKFRRFV